MANDIEPKFILALHPKLNGLIKSFHLTDSFPVEAFFKLLYRYYNKKPLDAFKKIFALDDAMIGELVGAYEEDEAYLEQKRLAEDPDRAMA